MQKPEQAPVLSGRTLGPARKLDLPFWTWHDSRLKPQFGRFRQARIVTVRPEKSEADVKVLVAEYRASSAGEKTHSANVILGILPEPQHARGPFPDMENSPAFHPLDRQNLAQDILRRVQMEDRLDEILGGQNESSGNRRTYFSLLDARFPTEEQSRRSLEEGGNYARAQLVTQELIQPAPVRYVPQPPSHSRLHSYQVHFLELSGIREAVPVLVARFIHPTIPAQSILKVLGVIAKKEEAVPGKKWDLCPQYHRFKDTPFKKFVERSLPKTL